ncbi:unnamed protein product, partial [Iphiclides podalirius]
MWSITLMEPALQPLMVTRLGSPPNAAIFLWTHFKAATWSLKPLFPGARASPVLRNPVNRKLNTNRLV